MCACGGGGGGGVGGSGGGGGRENHDRELRSLVEALNFLVRTYYLDDPKIYKCNVRK